MKYNVYPSYKDSGVEWLGNVPSEWSVVRNKQVFSFIKQLVGKNSKDYTLLSLTLQGIKVRDIESGKGKFPAEFDTYQSLLENDIVFCLFDIDETPRTVGISGYKGMITGAYNVARCNKEVSPKYIYYYYLAIDERKGLKPFYTGLRKVVRSETFMNLKLPMPSYQEQQNIVKYLDKSTEKIDVLIEKQKTLVTLLKEKRQAVISAVITRGLDDSIPVQDTNIDILGKIPKHWTVTKFKYEISFQEGPGIMAKDFHAHGVPLIRIHNLSEKIVSCSFKQYLDPKLVEKKWNHFKVVQGDLLISASASTGIVSQVGLDVVGAIPYTGIIRLNPNSKNITMEYIKWFILSDVFLLQIEKFKQGATMQHFGPYHLNMMIALKVPLLEQESISDYLKESTNQIDILISTSNRMIGLLKEKRTTLISAAVTGEIDVREVA